ncbi:MAG TPA: tetraacyldisaccharide 4'-kinase [Candidatus Angelobacter sp.]
MNPLSAIFGAGVALRNAAYDHGVFKVRKLARPVVSVGNISVGGSGKTPFVIALGQLLKERGVEFDVLSRGYGRSSTEIAVVDANGSPTQFGDEPILIARKLSVPVIVGADRYQAGLLAEQRFASKLHLLDDGFQHRRLRRDFDIVLVQASDLEDSLLPAGRLREPLSALRRADVAVSTPVTAVPGAAGVIWRIRREVLLDPPCLRAVAFCGLGRPAQFFSHLRQLSLDLADTVCFPDHHGYTESDVARLLARKASTGAAAFITTEKDVINLGGLAGRLQPLQTAQLRLMLGEPEQALSTLLSTLERRCGCRF